MSGNSDEHLDLAALAELKDIMEDDFPVLIDTFVADVEIKLLDMVQIIASGDAEALRQIAHSVKGSSGNVSAIQLSEYARMLESMGRDNKLDGATDVYVLFKEEYEAVKGILLAQC